MHLVYQAREGQELPSILRPGLVPPSKRKGAGLASGPGPHLPGAVPVLPGAVPVMPSATPMLPGVDFTSSTGANPTLPTSSGVSWATPIMISLLIVGVKWKKNSS